MFGIINSYIVPEVVECIPVEVGSHVIEGLELIEQLCPVNPLTGKRSSLIEAVQTAVADPKKAYLVDKIMKELPALRADPKLDDEGRLMLLSERLSSGTPSEDEAFMERLSSMSDILFRGAPQAVKEVVKPLEDKPVAPAVENASVSE